MSRVAEFCRADPVDVWLLIVLDSVRSPQSWTAVYRSGAAMRYYFVVYALIILGFPLFLVSAVWHFMHGQWWFGLWSGVAAFVFAGPVFGLALLLRRTPLFRDQVPQVLVKAFRHRAERYVIGFSYSFTRLPGTHQASNILREASILAACAVPVVLFLRALL